MKNTLKPLPSFLAEEKTEDDITWLHRQLEGEDDALTSAYLLGYRDGKISKANSLTKPLTEAEEQCAFCEKPDVFRKGLCPICFEDHYGDR